MNIKFHKLTNVSFIVLLLVTTGIHPCLNAAREERINKIEVFVSTYCYRVSESNGPEILLLKRSASRELFPNVWECGGGSVHENESFEDAAKRQLLEEAGITATRWKIMECFQIEVRPDIIVPGIAFSCKAGPDVQVKIDPKEHTNFRWVTIKDLEDLALISKQMRQNIVKILMSRDKLF